MQSAKPSPPASSPKLIDDIFLSVLSLSCLQAATSMMATCHFLYHEGAKIILHHFPMSFGADVGKDKALALLRFIKAEQLSRCSHVRILHVSMHPMPTVIAAALAILLPRMSSLDTLVVTIEDILQAHPRLLPAFASLRSVKTLHMTNTGKRCCELLKTLQSQLVMAKIYFAPINPQSTEPPPLTPDLHPLTMLQRSAPTLETLLLGFWIDVDFGGSIFFRPAVTYPKMNAFLLHECLTGNILPYVNSFPNVTELLIKDDRPNPWEEGQQGISEFHRDINLEVARGAVAACGGAVEWKNLKEYYGKVVDLWLFGLTCRVGFLDLEDTPTTRPPLALTDVLGYARPTRLTICFKKCSLTDVLRSDFLGALRSKGASELTSLAFTIELRAKDRGVDLGRALADIEATISRLALTGLYITVTDAGLDDPQETSGARAAGAAGRRRGADAQKRTSGATATAAAAKHDGIAGAALSETSGSLSVGERTMDAFDVAVFLSRLTDTIPTLEDACVSVPRPRRCGSEGRCARLMDSTTQLPEGGVVYKKW